MRITEISAYFLDRFECCSVLRNSLAMPSVISINESLRTGTNVDN